MPHPCVVCGRSRMNPNNRVEEYTFFGFPVNDEPRCKKWLEFCCREELYKLTKKQLLQRMICSKHFLSSDFVNDLYDRLNSTAVPSIYDPKQSLYNISCVLCGRFRKNPPGPENDDATFHHFPGEEFRCLEWLDFVGVDSYYRLTRKEIMFCYICSKHFDRNQFTIGFYNRLIDTAVPNVKYPDENITVKESNDMVNLINEVELFNSCEKSTKKVAPLPAAVLDSQACAACGRSRYDPNNKAQKYKFHPFPAYEIGRCLKWCRFLEREDILKMSPNQIRRLVLCSRHFQAGQNFNNGSSGPCDAVPSIRECEAQDMELASAEAGARQDSEAGSKLPRASVSSKKPKMKPGSKPTPLAKKRGKSKRPTTINIPKIEAKVDDCVVKKLPIPTANNWKLLANQFQPITVTNNIVSSCVPSDVKKVILPFAGDIANLGAPIPVHSLSSMPPGLLIKINLPEQKAGGAKLGRARKKKRRAAKQEQDNAPDCEEKQNKIRVKTLQGNVIECVPGNSEGEYLAYTDSFKEMRDGKVGLQEVEEEEGSYLDFEEEVRGVSSQDEEMCFENVKVREEGEEEVRTKLKMSARCRRTLLPIQCELRRFLIKLKPYVRRLPKKSKAKVKLAILNKVLKL